jgi:hypothetical protein
MLKYVNEKRLVDLGLEELAKMTGDPFAAEASAAGLPAEVRESATR